MVKIKAVIGGLKFDLYLRRLKVFLFNVILNEVNFLKEYTYFNE